jgi:hypothetical protein
MAVSDNYGPARGGQTLCGESKPALRGGVREFAQTHFAMAFSRTFLSIGYNLVGKLRNLSQNDGGPV